MCFEEISNLSRKDPSLNFSPFKHILKGLDLKLFDKDAW